MPVSPTNAVESTHSHNLKPEKSMSRLSRLATRKATILSGTQKSPNRTNQASRPVLRQENHLTSSRPGCHGYTYSRQRRRCSTFSLCRNNQPKSPDSTFLMPRTRSLPKRCAYRSGWSSINCHWRWSSGRSSRCWPRSRSRGCSSGYPVCFGVRVRPGIY